MSSVYLQTTGLIAYLLAHFVLIITSGSRFKFFFEHQRTCMCPGILENFQNQRAFGPGLLNVLRFKEASKNWQFS
jgi:hypothetical protein